MSVQDAFEMLIFATTAVYSLGLFVIWNGIFDTANASRFQGKLPDLSLISSLLNIFIKPYLKTWRLESIPRAIEVKKPVEKVVRQKIKQLQPFLQDDDIEEAETDNEITLKGNDETTIIEFSPRIGEESKKDLRNGNDTFKANMRRYKKVRNKIYEALEAEMVSNKTKKLVIQILDELLSKMVATQCHWKGGLESTGDKTERYDSTFIIPRTIVNLWREEWQKLKTKFSTLPRVKKRKQKFDILMSYLTKLNSIINDVSVNMESFAKKYRIRCNVTERKDYKKNKSRSQIQESFRLSHDSDNDKDICKNFKVCSNELKHFFIDFYNTVNDTSVNVLRSYAEMFTRDVNTDVSNEKNSIVDLIFKIADETENDIIDIFVNYTAEFQLDQQKDKEANVKFVHHYVKNVIQYIKGEVSKNIFKKLNHLHKRVSSSIHQDIVVNLGIELENLERDLTSKICLIFNICNGNQKIRRLGDNEIENDNLIDDNNKIYVKVDVTIDEDRNDLSNKAKAIQTNEPKLELNAEKVSDGLAEPRNVKVTPIVNYEKYANISITRTTLKWQSL